MDNQKMYHKKHIRELITNLRKTHSEIVLEFDIQGINNCFHIFHCHT